MTNNFCWGQPLKLQLFSLNNAPFDNRSHFGQSRGRSWPGLSQWFSRHLLWDWFEVTRAALHVWPVVFADGRVRAAKEMGVGVAGVSLCDVAATSTLLVRTGTSVFGRYGGRDQGAREASNGGDRRLRGPVGEVRFCRSLSRLLKCSMCFQSRSLVNSRLGSARAASHGGDHRGAHLRALSGTDYRLAQAASHGVRRGNQGFSMGAHVKALSGADYRLARGASHGVC